MRRVVAAVLVLLVATRLAAAVTEAPGAPAPTGTPISMNVKDGDLQDVLRAFADMGGLNLVLDPKLAGRTVTLVLDEVPFEQALEVVLRTHGLGATMEGNVLRVAPLQALVAEAQALSAHRAALQSAGDLRTVARPLSHAQAAEAERLVRPLLSERGTTMVDRRTNTLFIKDTAATLGDISGALDLFDPASPLLTRRDATPARPGPRSPVTLTIRTFELAGPLWISLDLAPARQLSLGGIAVNVLDTPGGLAFGAMLAEVPGTTLLHASAAGVGIDESATVDLGALRTTDSADSLELVVSPRLDGGKRVLTYRLRGRDSGRAIAWFQPAGRTLALELVAPLPDGGEVRHAVLVEPWDEGR